MQKLKICFVTEDFYPNIIGGQGIHAFHLVNGLAHLDHQVTVLAENKSGRLDFWQKYPSIKFLAVPYCFGNQLALAFLEYLTFRLKLHRQHFDILHAFQLSGLFFVLFKPKNINKIIIWETNTHFDILSQTFNTSSWFKKRLIYPLFIFLEKLLYRKADAIIFNSPEEQQSFSQFFPPAKNQLLQAIYLGSPKVKFTTQQKTEGQKSIKKQFGLPENAQIVLYVGRLVARKKVDILIKALKTLPPSHPSVYGVIVGDGPERKNLERLADSHVHFTGFVTHPRKYYLAANLFVTVSVAEGGFLLSALEAANFALPLILSPSAAGFPIIKEGINGYIVSPDNYQDLAEKISLALKKSARMGRNSQNIVRKFTWERCVQKTANFYQQVLEKSVRTA